MRRHRKQVVLLLGLGAFWACTGTYSGPDGSTDGANSRVTVSVAADSIPGADSAVAWISRFELLAGSDSTGTVYTVAFAPVAVNLLQHAAGTRDTLGNVTVPRAGYSRARIVIDSVRIRRDAALKFSDSTRLRTLVPPAADSLGTVVTFAEALDANAGQEALIVAFNAARAFVFTGTTAHPTGVTFAPAPRALAANARGSIAGTVSPAAAKATVYAILGTDTVWTTRADTTSGAYVLRYLSPGTYTVRAVGTSLSVNKTVFMRGGLDTTGVALP